VSHGDRRGPRVSEGGSNSAAASTICAGPTARGVRLRELPIAEYSVSRVPPSLAWCSMMCAQVHSHPRRVICD
jgi:hypothetical protein